MDRITGNRSEARAAVRAGIGIGVTTGAYGLSFGAISVGAGLSVLQTCALSLAMFTGGSQFAFVGVVAGGGTALAGATSAVLLGLRNSLYGLRLAPLLRLRGWPRFAGAQLVIDESTAVALSRPNESSGRVGFWVTGIAVFVLWNAGTCLGAVGAQALAGPRALGFDAAVPAAFLALLAPMVRSREQGLAAVAGAGVALTLCHSCRRASRYSSSLWQRWPSGSPRAAAAMRPLLDVDGHRCRFCRLLSVQAGGFVGARLASKHAHGSAHRVCAAIGDARGLDRT